MSKKLEYIDPDQLIIIGLDTPDGVEHALFDERVHLPLDESLVRSIMVYGVQQAVHVRQEEATHYVVDGRQRVRAAREAKKRQSESGEVEVAVPVQVVRADDKHIAGIMITNNEIRQSDDLLTRAMKAARMLDRVGDMNQVCAAFGRSKQTLQGWLNLVEASPLVHEAVRAGKISASAAIAIADLPRADQEKALAATLAANEKAANADAGEGATPTPVSRNQALNEKREHSSRQQQGVRRSWLRKALKTEAAKQLDDEQRAVLEWFATGDAEPETWFGTFALEATIEIGE